ncbi:MAG: HAD-IIB family hydrolase [Bacilli bacterium]|nr:HAD-IIB family hydrolase [Bacilli bacterium]
MKYIFIDIDGVVLKDNKLNNELLDVLKLKKVKYVFCTGRGYYRTLDVVKNYISMEDIIIVENGSKILSSNGEIIASYPITDEEVVKIRDIDYTDIEYALYVPNGTCDYIVYDKKDFSEKLKHSKLITKNFNIFLNELKNKGASQLTIKFKKSFNQELFDSYIKAAGLNCSKSEDYYSINHKHISKKSAIENIILKYKIKKEEVIIIGNDYNDIEMFQLDVGYKIAVIDDNTPSDLIINATNITSFDDIASLLEEII